jgi:PAS domain S-box-containing protein
MADTPTSGTAGTSGPTGIPGMTSSGRATGRDPELRPLVNLGTAFLDLRSNEVEYSDEVYRILEIDRDACPDAVEAGLAMVHTDDRTLVADAFDRLMTSHQSLDLECRVVVASGIEKRVRIRGRVDVDATGAPYCAIGAVQDLTVRRTAEIGLRRVLAQHQYAQSLAELGTWTRDIETGELTVSDEMLRVFELDAEELAAGAMSSVVHPADRGAMERALRSLYDDRTPYDRRIRLLMPDGRIKHVRATGRIHDDAAGQPLTAVGAAQDITDEVEAAERFRKMTTLLQRAESMAQIGSWELELRSRELRWSDEIFRLFELDRDEVGPSYDRFLALVHPDDRELMDVEYRRSVRQHCGYDFVHRLQMPDGRLKWVHERGHTDYDDDGRPTLSLGTVQDVTRAHLAELEVRELNADLERRIEERTADLALALHLAEAASQAKSAFLTAMSHELRTPLNAVLGYAQLLETDDRLPDDLRQNVSTIRSSGGRLLELVSAAIDLAQVESGKIRLQMEHLDLAGIVGPCVQQAGRTADASDIAVSVEESVASIVVHADRLRLSQVVEHLVSNAITYNRSGGSVIISGTSSDDGYVRLHVADTGQGFDPDLGQQLFEPFNRLGRERGAAEGAGVGLAISRRLVREMGGDLGCSSVPGAGSTFWLELPGSVGSADSA